jgi:hypothetical protein
MRSFLAYFSLDITLPGRASCDQQEACWEAMLDVFSSLLGPYCGSVLPWDADAGPLNDVCVYWWWLAPCPALVEDDEASQRASSLQLRLINHTLAMPWESCQASGLEGLLLRALHKMGGVEESLATYLSRQPAPSQRMRQLAGEVREHAGAFSGT